MKHLTQLDIDTLREALETERISLQEELAMYGQKDVETGEWEGSSADETAVEESDPVDVADQLEELTVNIPLVADLQQRLHDVNDALGKIEGGKYGICEVSGDEIPLDRLKANPAARTTIEHADQI